MTTDISGAGILAGEASAPIEEPITAPEPQAAETPVADSGNWLDKIPGFDSDYAENAEYWGKLGVPEAPDKYTWGEAPEGYDPALLPPKEMLNKFAEIAHQNKISQAGLEALYKANLEVNAAMAQQAVEAHQAEQASRNQGLLELWGDQVEAKSTAASQAINTLANAEQKAFFQENAEAFNHPMFLDMLATIGEHLKGASQPGAASTATSGFSGTPQQQSQSRIDEIYRTKSEILYNPGHPEHKAVNNELNKLYERIHS